VLASFLRISALLSLISSIFLGVSGWYGSKYGYAIDDVQFGEMLILISFAILLNAVFLWLTAAIVIGFRDLVINSYILAAGSRNRVM
jgi:hypothetical protein